MAGLTSLARMVFGSANDRRLKRYAPKVVAVNALEAEVSALSDEELRARTAKFKADVAAGARLDDLLEPAFATVREAAKRTLGQRHFDVQLIGGMVLKLVMTCPAMRSMAIGPPPLYGTASRLVFVIILNISPAKCSGLPTPEVA